MTAHNTARALLLTVALIGILVSVFWDYILVEQPFSSETPAGTGAFCPFAKTPLAKGLNALPDVSASTPILDLTGTHICADCVTIDDTVYQAGPLIGLFTKQELAAAELAILLGAREGSGGISKHSKDAAVQLVRNKLSIVGRKR